MQRTKLKAPFGWVGGKTQLARDIIDFIPNELFIKQVICKDSFYYLRSLNKDYEDIKVKDLMVIGKVKGVLNRSY